MINKIIFGKFNSLKYPLVDDWKSKLLKEFEESSSDPFLGIINWRDLKTNIIFYHNKTHLNFYYLNQFTKIHFLFRPLYPYFKGNILIDGIDVRLEGSIGFNKFYSNVGFIYTIIVLVFFLIIDPYFPSFLLVIIILTALFQVLYAKKLAKKLDSKIKNALQQTVGPMPGSFLV